MSMKRTGESSAALPQPDEPDLLERSRFVAGVRRGLEDVEAGRVISDEELSRRLDLWFGPLPKTR
jgi:predicted transcriptional regulator